MRPTVKSGTVLSEKTPAAVTVSESMFDSPWVMAISGAATGGHRAGSFR